MKSLRLIIAALAATAAFGTAAAEEVTEVIVVKAQRPAEPEAPEFVAIEAPTPEIDFAKIPIEAPTLDQSDREFEPERVELAMRETSDTKT
jgi:hypothetical protein